MCVSRVFYCFNSVLKLSLWYLQFQARSSQNPTPGICGAFSNFSFPSFSWHVVHFKFPDYPQCKNIKNELITIVWVSLRADEIKLWVTNQSLVIVCTQATFGSVTHFSGWRGSYRTLPPTFPTPTSFLVPRIFLFPRPRANEKMAERSFDIFVEQDIEFVSSWLSDQGLEGLIELLRVSDWSFKVYLPF